MSTVSAIIITYNRAVSLRSAISSVLNQTFQDFELIVVDDASTDNTAAVVQSFNDQRIRYIRHDTNKKEAGARNTGVQNAHGEYIAFLDDDDEWLPTKLERQVEIMKKSTSTMGGVYTGFYKVDRRTGSTLQVVIPQKKGFILNDLIAQNEIGMSTILLRRECFQKAGLFDENIVFGLDYDMWIRISKDFTFDYVKDPLMKYGVHENSISTNYKLMAEGLEAHIRKHSTLFERDPKNHSYRYLELGVAYCRSGNMKRGRRAFMLAVRIYPFDVRHLFNLGLSFLGCANFIKFKMFRDRLAACLR